MICTIGIVGGTGSRPIVRGARREEHRIGTRFGPVDVSVVFRGTVCFAYLYRHGIGHSVPPHCIRHEAAMDALRAMGVRDLIGINAVGSLRADLPAGSILLVSDFIAAQSVTPPAWPLAIQHTDLSVPYCERLRSQIARALLTHPGFRATGVLAGVVGPRFETPSEVTMLRQLGADVVGMTGVPEAIAARDAGFCYASLACVTNLGVGLTDQRLCHGDVTRQMEAIVAGIVPPLMDIIGSIGECAPCTLCGGSSAASGGPTPPHPSSPPPPAL